MPTYKHPCPHCAKYIARDVAACPFCGTADPFAPARCPNCRAVVEDRAWLSCPKCGQPLPKVATATGAPTPGGQAAPAGQSAPAGQAAGPTVNQSSRCTGCGAPLAAGARFCAVCGTLAN
jgi:rRNA maturation endonuclease Nob1